MRVVDSVHGDTFHLEIGLTLAAVCVIFVTCFSEWFFFQTTAGNDTDGCTAAGVESFELTRRHQQHNFVASADDGGGCSGCAHEFASVSWLSFNVVNETSFRNA